MNGGQRREAVVVRSAEQLAAEEEQLRESLTSLSQLATSRLPLGEALTRIAALAVHAIPGAEGAGLTLLEEYRRDTVVTTTDFVSAVDAIQYGLDQGPCITAAAEDVTVISGSLGGDPRWPKFGAQVARLGVHSVVSLPLKTSDRVVGAMNVYAHDKHVFDDRAAEIGQYFAAPAAIAVENAHVLDEARRLITRRRDELEERGVVDQAVGIMMSRAGGSAEEALERLRALSQDGHQRLVDVARSLVEEAARRAQSRHTTGEE